MQCPGGYRRGVVFRARHVGAGGGFAVWRPHTPPRSVLLGLLASVLIWAWALLIPALAQGYGLRSDWLVNGPLSLQWLAPDHLFWLEGWSRLSRAVFLSLLVGSILPLLHAAYFKPEIAQSHATGLSRETLRKIALRFLPQAFVQGLMQEHPEQLPALRNRIERELSSAPGAASARLLFDAAQRQQGADLDTVAAIVGEASQALRFNQQVLEAALENMSQGISVVDSQLRLVAWNMRYADLFQYPASLLKVGVSIEKLVAYNVQRGLLGESRTRNEVAKRIAFMKSGTAYITERQFGDSIVEIRGNPMPGGGFVATFTDVTEFRTNERKLKQIAETLEARVTERTAQLQSAKADAEAANRAKSRFLAAVSHDLAQPLNAAHLFTHALTQRMQHGQYLGSLANIDGALNSAESLCRPACWTFHGWTPAAWSLKSPSSRSMTFCAAWPTSCPVLATEKNITLAFVPSRLWVRSDAGLLRRNTAELAVQRHPLYNARQGIVRLPTAGRPAVDTGLGHRARHRIGRPRHDFRGVPASGPRRPRHGSRPGHRRPHRTAAATSHPACIATRRRFDVRRRGAAHRG